MVLTAKHCDGFAMYDSEVSEYNIVDWTPFKRDVSADTGAACKKQGVKLGFYYSHWWDWHEKSNGWDCPTHGIFPTTSGKILMPIFVKNQCRPGGRTC